MAQAVIKDKSLESWIWETACFICGAKDAPKYKACILPLNATGHATVESLRMDCHIFTFFFHQ